MQQRRNQPRAPIERRDAHETTAEVAAVCIEIASEPTHPDAEEIRSAEPSESTAISVGMRLEEEERHPGHDDIIPVIEDGGTLDVPIVHGDVVSLPMPLMYTPPLIENPKWDIFGTDCQILQTVLDPHESVQVGYPGVVYVSRDCKTRLQWPTFSRFEREGKRVTQRVINDGDHNGYAGITSSKPGVILPVSIDRFPEGVCFPFESFVASIGNVESSLDRVIGRPLLPCRCCPPHAPAWFVNYRRNGRSDFQNFVFIRAGGTVLERTLAHGENMLIHEDHLLGFSGEVGRINVRRGKWSVLFYFAFSPYVLNAMLLHDEARMVKIRSHFILTPINTLVLAQLAVVSTACLVTWVGMILKLKVSFQTT